MIMRTINTLQNENAIGRADAGGASIAHDAFRSSAPIKQPFHDKDQE